jgi:cytochrome d ubiquinol oxidase subunit II
MLDLQTTWFLLIGVLLVGYAILDGFDLGVGMLHLFVAKTDRERRIVANSVGPVWDGNEVWLLTGGGALFAAFPNVYATVFSAFYLALMLVLAALIFRAVSLEFRSKEESARWRGSWDWAFALGSALPALLFGVAIGNVLHGLPLDAAGDFTGTFVSLLNPFALVVGLLSTAMFLMQGAAWLVLKTEGAVATRARRIAFGAWGAFAVLWLAATVAARWGAPQVWAPYSQALPWLAPTILLAAIVSFPLALRSGRKGLTLTVSSVAIAALMAIVGQGLYPYIVPALGAEEALSLSIYTASSSPYTLKAMLVIALVGMPLVIGYTLFIYSRFRGPVVLDDHSY